MNAYEQRSHQVINYMKLHLISLEQDLETDIYSESDNIKGQISATRHLLSVVADILGIYPEEK